jgi:hypothetical protein
MHADTHCFGCVMRLQWILSGDWKVRQANCSFGTVVCYSCRHRTRGFATEWPVCNQVTRAPPHSHETPTPVWRVRGCVGVSPVTCSRQLLQTNAFTRTASHLGMCTCSLLAWERIHQFATNLACLFLESRKRTQRVRTPKKSAEFES